MHLPAWRSLPRVQVVAVSDAGSGAAAKLPGNHRPYSDWRELMDRPDLDAIDVVAPPAAHKAIVLEALARGRHVLCEKPFGATLDEALAMRAACGPHQIGAVGYQFRFEPAFRKLRQLAQSRAVGDVLRFDVRWMYGGRADPARIWGFQHDGAAGGGVGNAFLSHVLDYVLWITDGRLHTDGGVRATIVAKRFDRTGRQRPVTAEDSADFLGRLDNGVTVNIAVSNCVSGGEGHCVDLYGTEGRIALRHRFPFRNEDVELVLHRRDGVQPQQIETTATDADPRYPAVRNLLSLFLQTISGGPCDDLPTFDDGVAVHRVLDAWRGVAPVQVVDDRDN